MCSGSRQDRPEQHACSIVQQSATPFPPSDSHSSRKWDLGTHQAAQGKVWNHMKCWRAGSIPSSLDAIKVSDMHGVESDHTKMRVPKQQAKAMPARRAQVAAPTPRTKAAMASSRQVRSSHAALTKASTLAPPYRTARGRLENGSAYKMPRTEHSCCQLNQSRTLCPNKHQPELCCLESQGSGLVATQ